MAKITEVEGIGPVNAEKLEGCGITTREQLLEQCAEKKGRAAVADKSGISEKQILSWTNRADLCRVKGIGEEYADLLECAGVDTVPELAQRKAENLYQKLEEINKEKSLVRALPSGDQVTKWVEEAKTLPKKVTH